MDNFCGSKFSMYSPKIDLRRLSSNPSNIFNIMAVLGITSLITPIPVKDAALFSFDYWWMLGLALLVFPFMGLFTKDRLGRFEGLILLAAYVVYIVLTLQSM